VKLIHAIYGLLLAILALLGWLMILPEPTLVTGAPHPLFPGMNMGGDGAARLGHASRVIGVLGSLIMLLMQALPMLGVSARRRDGAFWVLMAVVACAAQGTWWAMYLGYLAFLETGETRFVFGFPVPTTWMLFGVWSSGALFCLIYIIGFRRFVFTAEDEAAYEALRAHSATPRAERTGTRGLRSIEGDAAREQDQRR
jgi:hypothetical protein